LTGLRQFNAAKRSLLMIDDGLIGRKLMSELTGKVAVVTGASKGIGAAIAKDFGAAGASVVVNYAFSKEGAERIVTEINGKGGKAIAIQGDMSKAKDVQRLFEETKKAFGSLDVLVNDAGVYAFEPLEGVTETEFHRQFNINVLGNDPGNKRGTEVFRTSWGKRDQPQLRRK
jgi:NAD(P)-dependent dehydrogenase (short-subunit alcohol dehydrogenase family)